jgi:hypothetical protein
MHSYTSAAAIAAKILRNPGGRRTSVLAGTPKKQACGTAFDPSQLHERDATEPHIRLNVYHADTLPREPIRIVRGKPEPTVAWPKHGDASWSHGTFLPAASRDAIPWDLLHVTGPSQCPRVDEPHIRHPSPAPGLRSPGAPEKVFRMRCGEGWWGSRRRTVTVTVRRRWSLGGVCERGGCCSSSSEIRPRSSSGTTAVYKWSKNYITCWNNNHDIIDIIAIMDIIHLIWYNEF